MEEITNNDKFKIKRVSAFKEEYLLIIFMILLYIELDNYIRLSSYNNQNIVANSIEYVIIFLALACLYFPKKINLNQKVIFIASALIFRFRALFIIPIISSDLHRNLLFGSVLADGYNPYLWTIQNLPLLIQKGLLIKVSYTRDWAINSWPTHSFDYPSLAIFFFAIITFLVPADNFSAFVLAKLVLMLVDILNAYLIYRILTVHFNLNEVSKKIALLYLINPLSIFWVNIEGQFESIPLFFILLSFYFLFYIKEEDNQDIIENYSVKIKKVYLPYIIGFTLGCGVLFKYFPLIFAIPIIFYFGKRITYTINFIISLIGTIAFLSFPFLENSFYITNFIFFQITRKSNTISDANYNIGFGIEIPVFLIITILIGIVFIFSLRKKLDKKVQTSILGLFSMYAFIYINNSIFSWYVIWLFGSLLFINTQYDEFFRSILWVISLIILIFIWRPDYLFLIIQIVIISYIITLEKVRILMKRYFYNIFFPKKANSNLKILSNRM